MKLDRLSLSIGAAASALVFAASAVIGLTVPTTSAQMPTMDQQVTELRQMAQNAHAAALRAQMIATVYQLDTAGLHELDERTAAGTIPPGSLGRVRRTRVAIQATTWPEPLGETVTNLTAEMVKLEEALRDESASRASGPAHEAHELGHRLSDQAYGWLSGSGQLGTQESGPGMDHSTGPGTSGH
jgi:hypothetical protein